MFGLLLVVLQNFTLEAGNTRKQRIQREQKQKKLQAEQEQNNPDINCIDKNSSEKLSGDDNSINLSNKKIIQKIVELEKKLKEMQTILIKKEIDRCKGKSCAYGLNLKKFNHVQDFVKVFDDILSNKAKIQNISIYDRFLIYKLGEISDLQKERTLVHAYKKALAKYSRTYDALCYGRYEVYAKYNNFGYRSINDDGKIKLEGIERALKNEDVARNNAYGKLSWESKIGVMAPEIPRLFGLTYRNRVCEATKSLLNFYSVSNSGFTQTFEKNLINYRLENYDS